MKIQATFFCLLLIVSSHGLHSQELNQPSLSLKERVDRGLSRSDLQAFLDASKNLPKEAYEFGLAIIAAGNSNDPFWIPYLKPFARKEKISGANIGRVTQLALSRLDEEGALQEIACELNYGTPLMRYDAVTKKLRYVRGWFSIRMMVELMNDDTDHQPLLKTYQVDVVYGSPRFESLFVLPDVVPNPPNYPLPQPDESSPEVRKLRQAWTQWIRENQDTLQKLPPSGNGVEASEKVCKRVLKEDRGFDRSLR